MATLSIVLAGGRKLMIIIAVASNRKRVYNEWCERTKSIAGRLHLAFGLRMKRSMFVQRSRGTPQGKTYQNISTQIIIMIPNRIQCEWFNRLQIYKQSSNKGKKERNRIHLSMAVSANATGNRVCAAHRYPQTNATDMAASALCTVSEHVLVLHTIIERLELIEQNTNAIWANRSMG